MTYTATIDEIAKMMNWTVGYARKIASMEGWRTSGTRPQRYDLRDVARHSLPKSER